MLKYVPNYSEKKKMSLVKKYNCSHCNYVSDRKWTIKDHEKRMHKDETETNYVMQNNRAPVTMYVGENGRRAPTSVFIGTDAPTTIYTQPTQFGRAEVYQIQIIHQVFLMKLTIKL